MSRAVLLALAFALAAAGAAGAASSRPSEQVVRGRLLVQRYCAGCHAVTREGVSPHAAAPPFRDLHDRYPINSLAEALAEGILVGHPAMPEMRFPPSDVSAILAYIASIQTQQHAVRRAPDVAPGR
ncbi:MAG: cytochrome c [Proteobacteria bacterium]|nr:cytochrome c [Pseudomonadota bacterium]